MGICDERGQWLGLHESVGQRSSAQLHADLHQLCEAQRITPQDITQIAYLAGPGFYTGLRIAYGIAQTLKLAGLTTASFYAYDVPGLLGEQEYTWITKAYRGEIFVYDSKNKRGSLLTEDEFFSRSWEGKIYIHHTRALDDKMRAKLTSVIETEGLIAKNFSLIRERTSQESELYYFRAPEDEFRPNP